MSTAGMIRSSVVADRQGFTVRGSAVFEVYSPEAVCFSGVDRHLPGLLIEAKSPGASWS